MQYRTEPCGLCCPHGYLGRDLEEKDRLVETMGKLSQHFKDNKEFLAPLTGNTFPATKHFARVWTTELRRKEPLLHDILASDMSSRGEMDWPRPSDNHFEDMIKFIKCPVCEKLKEANLPACSNPKLLIGQFHDKSKGSTNAETEELDNRVDRAAELGEKAKEIFQSLVRAREIDPHVCMKVVKGVRMSGAKKKLREFLVSAYEGRPNLRTHCEPELYGLVESSESESGDSTTSESGSYRLAQTYQKRRVKPKKVLSSKDVVGIKAITSKDVLLVGREHRLQKVIKERDRSCLIATFSGWKARYKKIGYILMVLAADKLGSEDHPSFRSMIKDLRKDHKLCDKTLKLSKGSYNATLQLMSGADSDTTSSKSSDSSQPSLLG